MERSAPEVISSSIVKFCLSLVLVLFTLILNFVPRAFSQRSAAPEYIIIQNVDQLLIYNKYQQKTSPRERRVFVPFVPIRILDAEATLNDNYTLCMRVEVQGVLFYLIKNDKSTLMGAGKFGFHEVYNNVTLLQDTLQLVENSGAILISPNRTHQAPVTRGKSIARYFHDGDLTYVRVLGGLPNYGWIRFSEQVKAAVRHEEKRNLISDQAMSPAVLQRIDRKFFEANSVLSKLFLYFNKQKKQKKAIPQWHSASSDRTLAYKLEPDSYALSFSESDQYLTRDLENILLGTPYAVFYTPGRISIRRKY